jgi:hypothetical protein
MPGLAGAAMFIMFVGCAVGFGGSTIAAMGAAAAGTVMRLPHLGHFTLLPGTPVPAFQRDLQLSQNRPIGSFP